MNGQAKVTQQAVATAWQTWRLWAASLLIALFALGGLARALQEPSLGYRFVSVDGRIEALPLSSGRARLTDVKALSASSERVQITSALLTESAGVLNRYDEQKVFFAQHARLWGVLGKPQVAIEHAGGMQAVRVAGRDFSELGLRFWFPWAVGLLSMSVGLGVWVFRPGDASARWYMLASLGYAFGMVCIAGWGSRLLTQSPDGWPGLHVASHAGSLLLAGGLCMVLWSHPSRLGGRGFPLALAALGLASLIVDGMQWVPTIALAFRLPVVIMVASMAVLFGMQWRASQGDPVKRAQLKWLGLLLFAALSVVFVAYVFGAMGFVVALPQNYGLGLVGLAFLGLVPLVGRIGLFRLDRWWAAAWLWFLGGMLVVALDLLLLVLLPLSGEMALAIALAAGGWLYFPLRQALWHRLARGALPRTRDVLPDVVALITAGASRPAALNDRWAALWDRVFEPQHQSPCQHRGAVQIGEQGQTLRIPEEGALRGLELRLAARGARLFNPDDQRRAAEIVQLVRRGLVSQAAYERGVAEERSRIASDLHDDLGARLLTMVQSGSAGQSPQRLAQMAREALDEMRLSIRGLSGEPAPAADVLADWRAETVTRLSAAGIHPQWQAGDMSPGLMLPARLHLQLTRALRESVSNVIRHSGAEVCAVRVALERGSLLLDIEDDGCGLPAAENCGRGTGLASVERRARTLGGQFRLLATPSGGVHVSLRVPLEAVAPATDWH